MRRPSRNYNALAAATWLLAFPAGIALRWWLDRALDKSGRMHPR